jgi:hypothetical protein
MTTTGMKAGIPEFLTVREFTTNIEVQAPHDGFGTQPRLILWDERHVYNVAPRGNKSPDTYKDECRALAHRIRLTYNAHDEMLAALEALVEKHGPCDNDVLNPCLSGWTPGDEVRHWGGGDACPTCKARAAIANVKASA